tara:strand:+ start:1180 stop:1467 length:288 start_codon:yes stop_codon:yes gene_type:complete
MRDKQHREDTKYVQWQDGMYVMLDDLECDYELALVENSLRNTQYFLNVFCFDYDGEEDSLGVFKETGGYWEEEDEAKTKLTRAQALYIATGDVSI